MKAYPALGAIVQDAERQKPALFLLDIMFPGGDGLDLCRRLRQNPTLSSVPIIFLTARAAENDRVAGLELGADDYITKPFAMRELLARVKAVLRRFERPEAAGDERGADDRGAGDRWELDAVAGAWQAGDDDGDGVPAAGLSGAASGAGVQPRSSAGCGVGRCAVCDAAECGCVCAPDSREDRGRPGDSAVFEDDAWSGYRFDIPKGKAETAMR